MRQGNLSIGLNVDLPQFGMDDNRNINYRLRFNPNAGCFLTNNLQLIGQGHAGAFQQANDRYSLLRGQTVGGGFDFRWYFGAPEAKSGEIRRLRLFAQAGASIEYYWNQSNEGGSFRYRAGSPQLELRGGVGCSYLVTDRLALESSLIYKQWAIDYRPGNGEGRLAGQLGFRLFLKSARR